MKITIIAIVEVEAPELNWISDSVHHQFLLGSVEDAVREALPACEVHLSMMPTAQIARA